MEAQAMQAENEHCPQHVPTLHHYDPVMALLVMDYIPPPHDILRRALVAGVWHVGSFLYQCSAS